MIRLLIGGSPCTYWSIAQKNNRETVAEGLGWELFKNYLIAKEKWKPDYFLYENNKSASKAIKEQIKQEFGVTEQSEQTNIFDNGVRFTYINSALVSAQNRQRFYVTNFGDIEQPEDRGILLRDILDSGYADMDKAYCLKHQAGNARDNFKKHHTNVAFEEVVPTRIPPYGNEEKSRPLGSKYASNSGTGEGSLEGRIFSDNPRKQQVDLIAEPVNVTADGKCHTLKAQYYKNGIAKFVCNDGFDATGVAEPVQVGITIKHIYEVKDGKITIKGKQYPIKLKDGFYIIRKLSVSECMRLQTVPEWYIFPVSDTQAYKMLGNGWTVEVIKYLLSYIPNITKEPIEVLSMYDGMSCGQIALKEMGCNVVRYTAYEIDKYAIKTTMANFPNTIQKGDAFAVREEGWWI